MNPANSADVKQKVFDIIAEVCVINSSMITCKAGLQADLGIDSVDIVSLVLALEDEFGGSISDEEVEGLRTVGDVITHIDVKLSGAE